MYFNISSYVHVSDVTMSSAKGQNLFDALHNFNLAKPNVSLDIIS